MFQSSSFRFWTRHVRPTRPPQQTRAAPYAIEKGAAYSYRPSMGVYGNRRHAGDIRCRRRVVHDMKNREGGEPRRTIRRNAPPSRQTAVPMNIAVEAERASGTKPGRRIPYFRSIPRSLTRLDAKSQVMPHVRAMSDHAGPCPGRLDPPCTCSSRRTRLPHRLRCSCQKRPQTLHQMCPFLTF